MTSVKVISPTSTFSKAVDNPDTSDILKYELDVILVCLSPRAVDNPDTSDIDKLFNDSSTSYNLLLLISVRFVSTSYNLLLLISVT